MLKLCKLNCLSRLFKVVGFLSLPVSVFSAELLVPEQYTLTQAISVAQKYDVISVSNDYVDSTTILIKGKNNITIKSRTPYIYPQPTIVSTGQDAIVIQTSNYIKISDFLIKTTTNGYGIVIFGGNFHNIEHCTISSQSSSSSNTGIMDFESFGSAFKSNRILNFQMGYLLADTRQFTIGKISSRRMGQINATTCIYYKDQAGNPNQHQIYINDQVLNNTGTQMPIQIEDEAALGSTGKTVIWLARNNFLNNAPYGLVYLSGDVTLARFMENQLPSSCAKAWILNNGANKTTNLSELTNSPYGFTSTCQVGD